MITELKPINHKYDIRKVFKIDLKDYSLFEFFSINSLKSFVKKEIKNKSYTLDYCLKHPIENQDNIRKLTKEIIKLNECIKNDNKK